ncbi:TetR family transcriptional regulator [Pseudomonas sp. R5(2019)]|uniref:TetR family transcriptional regulator n=1 Tax=Pseudomonas sp. R5(2019) TaxID=2697566 RepID=UPI001411C360|nr:TetR family transcriptional regulator [Pseudomonas sp. R5(2019)]NBA96035.1 TetR family transcriptional regulator [Pseudomonas sp. R5(2019)]
MGKRCAADSAITRQALLDAALDVFAESGCAFATMERVASRAGMSRGAIYWHFKGRAALLGALLDERRLPVEDLNCAGLDLESGIGQLQAAVEATLSDPRSRQLCEVLLHKSKLAREDRMISKRLGEAQYRLARQLEIMLDNAVENSQLMADFNISTTIHFFEICFTGLMFECLRKPVECTQKIASVLLWLRAAVESGQEVVI